MTLTFILNIANMFFVTSGGIDVSQTDVLSIYVFNMQFV